MSLDVEEALWARIAQVEVTGLDGVDEVFVRGLEGVVWVHRGEKSLVRRHEPVGVALAQLHRCLLRRHLANSLLFGIPACSPPCDRVVRGRILLMLRQPSSDVEVGHLILHRTVCLGLTATGLASALQLLEATLTVVDGVVLPKDEVGAAEFVHCTLALVVRVELPVEGDALADLLFHFDICHFNFL